MQFDRMKRREFITLLGSAAAWPLAARAQRGEGTRRIGVLLGVADDAETKAWLVTFRNRLEQLGWQAPRNLQIDERWTGGDPERNRRFAGELVALKPDAIFAFSTVAVAALLNESRTIPIVFTAISDPVGSGFVASLARPGGNATGFTNFLPTMGAKWLEVLKEIAPRVERVVLLFNPQTAPYVAEYYQRPFEAAAPAFGVKTSTAVVHHTAEIEAALADLARAAGGGLVVPPDNFSYVHRELIFALAARHRLPAVYPFRFMAREGGLVSYGVDLGETFPRAAEYVDRILKGAKPADLPVQAPTKFELTINLKAAKALGLEIPPMLLARADEVIE
jgi:putative tryptophan/tyrosine transport system substrate-binding protein